MATAVSRSLSLAFMTARITVKHVRRGLPSLREGEAFVALVGNVDRDRSVGV